MAPRTSKTSGRDLRSHLTGIMLKLLAMEVKERSVNELARTSRITSVKTLRPRYMERERMKMIH